MCFPNRLKVKVMCDREVSVDLWILKDVRNLFISRAIYEKFRDQKEIKNYVEHKAQKRPIKKELLLSASERWWD